MVFSVLQTVIFTVFNNGINNLELQCKDTKQYFRDVELLRRLKPKEQVSFPLLGDMKSQGIIKKNYDFSKTLLIFPIFPDFLYKIP